MSDSFAITFYRRCHMCGATTEQEKCVEECGNCGKKIAPFFYFNETLSAVYSESLLRPGLMELEYSPLIGVSAQWVF